MRLRLLDMELMEMAGMRQSSSCCSTTAQRSLLPIITEGQLSIMQRMAGMRQSSSCYSTMAQRSLRPIVMDGQLSIMQRHSSRYCKASDDGDPHHTFPCDLVVD
jgi:hypothetical protein